jgi:uncharacterized membrane protein
MKGITTFFTSASAAFAVVPGVAVLLSNIGVPPTSSTALFSSTLEAIGALTLMILWINKNKIRERTEKKITQLAIGSAIIFIASLCTYFLLFGHLTESVPHSESLFFPLWPQGELKMDLQKFESRSEMITQFGRDDVAQLIETTSKTTLHITTILLLLLYQLIFVPLTFAFGLLAIKSTEN